eukprot:TRINITY_DN67893_c0_g2_i6.p1 TRINITY_DN67893_c0_g2~~TRINITY_DN67893_c0_g2_i6.p1  ORF type:complete len:219 (-),score=13.44 TRINITY_DN67893_c0_g2_i6:162-818(-)
MEECRTDICSGFKAFCKSAVKLTRQGRRSGGVICLVKNELSAFVKTIDVNHSNLCSFLIDKSLFGTDKDILYFCCYVPPEGSPFYAHFDVDNGISVLEDCLIECLITRDVYVILNGDLNSRTSNHSQDLLGKNTYDKQCDSQFLSIYRNSEDSILNKYGQLLLNVCTVLDLCILNGLCKGDLQGRYTYISDSGNSVNDYLIFQMTFLPSYTIRVSCLF